MPCLIYLGGGLGTRKMECPTRINNSNQLEPYYVTGEVGSRWLVSSATKHPTTRMCPKGGLFLLTN